MSKSISTRNIVVAVVIIAIVAVASTYGLMASTLTPTVVTSTQVAVTSVQAKPIKFCGSMHLTGANADSGVWVRESWELWAEYVNSQGGLLGRPVQIIVYDDGSDADRVVANLERCMSVDNTDILFGTNGSWAVYPALVVSEKNKKVMITGQGGAARIFNDRKPHYYAFAQPGAADLQPRSMFKFFDTLPDAQKPKTIAVACANDVLGDSIMKRITTELAPPRNIQVVYQDFFTTGTTDLSSYVLAIKAKSPDFLFACGGTPNDANNWLKAIKQVGFTTKGVWFLNGPQNPEWLKEVGSIADGSFGPISWNPYANTYQNQLFMKLWTERYGLEPVSDAAETWAAGQIYQQIITSAGSLDQDVMANFLHNSTFKTLYGGDLKYDQYGKPDGDYQLAQAQQGKLQIVFPADAATAQVIWPAAGATAPSYLVSAFALATVSTTSVGRLD